ncbi:hypothetical protein, partial [Streptococcus pneumoniae]|uniref:hypothetical protein n=1 Tax=Streptococcus pneumoniae TaxID=1313 RepID=UPI001E289FEF
NPHALSIKAGLSGRHIGKLLERGNGASAELETLFKIAEAAQVNPAWLTTGQGQPTSSETVDTHNPKMRSRPGFERALQAARLLRPQYP